jgi:hypothetical protein
MTPPGQVTDLAVEWVTDRSVTLTWTAPGDNGENGTATAYDIRHSPSPITNTNFRFATQVSGEHPPQPAGSRRTPQWG